MTLYYDIGLVMIYIESSSSGCTVGIAGTLSIRLTSFVGTVMSQGAKNKRKQFLR